MSTSLGSARWRSSTTARATRFWIVGASGIAVNQAILVAELAVGTMHYLVAAVIATQVAIAWNFLWTECWVFGTHEPPGSRTRRGMQFWAMNTITLLVHGPVLVVCTAVIGLPVAVGNLVALGGLAALRFVVSDRVIWNSKQDSTTSPRFVFSGGSR